MNTPFDPRPYRVRDAGSTLRIWFVLGMAAVLGMTASVQAQLNVVNGDFSDLVDLAKNSNGWYSGLPKGWSGSDNTYALYTKDGATPPTCNPGQLGFLRQNVGTLTRMSDVVLTFDASEHWAAEAVMGANHMSPRRRSFSPYLQVINLRWLIWALACVASG